MSTATRPPKRNTSISSPTIHRTHGTNVRRESLEVSGQTTNAESRPAVTRGVTQRNANIEEMRPSKLKFISMSAAAIGLVTALIAAELTAPLLMGVAAVSTAVATATKIADSRAQQKKVASKKHHRHKSVS